MYAPQCIGVDAVDFVTGPVLDRDRQVGGRELLTELRREGIELRGEVVSDDAGEVRGDVGLGEDIELGQRRGLIGERDFLAVAEGTNCSGKGSHFLRTGEEADEVRNGAHFTDARPVGLHAAGVTFVAGQAGIAAQAVVEFWGLLGLEYWRSPPGRAG